MAIKVPPSADMCIETLLQLLETKITYVVQEVVVVIRDIFRRYPNQYERVIEILCGSPGADNGARDLGGNRGGGSGYMDELTEPESKSAIAWIVGHYADRIDNAVELLDDLSYNFLEEVVEVSHYLVLCITPLSHPSPNSCLSPRTRSPLTGPTLHPHGCRKALHP
jgi:vesicle coat complex subunit